MYLLIRYPGFRWMWSGQLLSQLGNAIFYILGLWEIQLKSPFLLSVAGLAMTIPALLGMVGGVFVDRYDPRKIMWATDGLRGVAVGLGIVALAIPHALVYVIIVLLGFNSLGAAVFSPAENVMVPWMVRDRDLTAANGFYSLTFQLSSALGSVLGGAAVAVLGIRMVFGLDMSSFWISALAIGLMMRTVGYQRKTQTTLDEPEPRQPRFWGSLKEGIRGLKEIPWLTQLLPFILLANFSFAAAFTMMPFWIHHVLHANALWYGIVDGSWALGLVGGSLMSGRVSRWSLRGALTGLFGLMSILIGGFALSHAAGLSAVMLLGAGVMNGMGNALTFALMQRIIPEAIRGRVFGLIISLFSLANPLGAVFAGVLLPVLPLYWSWALSAVTGGALSMAVWRVLPTNFGWEASGVLDNVGET